MDINQTECVLFFGRDIGPTSFFRVFDVVGEWREWKQGCNKTPKQNTNLVLLLLVTGESLILWGWLRAALVVTRWGGSNDCLLQPTDDKPAK